MLEEIVSGIAILVLVIIIVLLGKIPSEDTSTIEGGMPREFPQFNQEPSQPVEYDPSLSVYVSATDNVSPNQAVRLDLQADDMVYKQTHVDDNMTQWVVAEYDDDEDIEVENEGGVSQYMSAAELNDNLATQKMSDLTAPETIQKYSKVSTHTFTDLNLSGPNINVRADNYYDPPTEDIEIENENGVSVTDANGEEELPQAQWGDGEFQSASEAQRAATLAMYKEDYAGNYTLRPPTL